MPLSIQLYVCLYYGFMAQSVFEGHVKLARKPIHTVPGPQTSQAVNQYQVHIFLPMQLRKSSALPKSIEEGEWL